VEEIKKDRDIRVASLRTEQELLQGRLDRLTSEHASLKVHAKSLNEENLRHQDDLKSANEHLKVSNDVR